MRTRRWFCRRLAAIATATLGEMAIPTAWAARRANDILVGLPNNVFANLYDGRPTGIMVEAVDLILRQMGKNPVYIVVPPANMVAALEDGTIALNTVTVQTPGNSNLALYSDPIISEYNVVAILATQALSVHKLADLRGLKLGGRQGFQYPLLEMDPGISLTRYAQDGELIRNLILGRIDAAIISALSDVYKLRAEGVMPRIRVLDKAVGEVPLRAALSLRTFTALDLADFNSRLAALKQSPAWTDILERNGFADLAVAWQIVPQ